MSASFDDPFQNSLNEIINEPIRSIAVYGFSDWHGLLENKLKHLGFCTLNWAYFSHIFFEIDFDEIVSIEKICKLSLTLIVKKNIELIKLGNPIIPVLFAIENTKSEYPKINLDFYAPKLVTVSEIKIIRKLIHDPYLPESFRDTALKTFKFVSVKLKNKLIHSIIQIPNPWTKKDLPLKNTHKLWRQMAVDYPLKKESKASSRFKRKTKCCVIS